jgi:hypothetical protein
MLGECLGRSPQVRYFGEADAAAFVNFALRDDASIQRLIDDCRFPFIVLRALKDSHRVIQLLDLHPAGKAIWAYRHYADRINSAVRMFGDHPLRVLNEWVKGRPAWQAAGMTAETEEALRRFDFSAMRVQDGAALMWWLRNSLFFSLGLDANDRVRPWSYDRFVREPRPELQSLLQFLDVAPDDSMLAQVHSLSVRKESEPPLASEVRALCEDLQRRLDNALRERMRPAPHGQRAPPR